MSDIAKMDNSSIYGTDEQRILDKTMDVREQMVDNFIRGGVPEKTNEIRVINEVLNSMDAQVMSKVSNRLKTDESKNDSEILSMVKNILLSSSTELENMEALEAPIIEQTLTEDDIVLGEDSIELTELDLNTIKGNTQ